MAFKTREDLYHKIIEAFSRQSEIRKITIFGKNAEGTSDSYSDIDIRVHSNNLPKTASLYLSLFNQISPVLGTFLIASNESSLSQMIMLKDYSPYQKIDFGICAGESPFSPSVTVYENRSASGTKSKMKILPIPYDTKYNLDNVLFSIPRMTKCFFRKDFDMYRRWRGMTNALLVILFEKYFGYEREQQKTELNAPESKSLFLKLSVKDQGRLDSILPRKGNAVIATSYLNSLDFYLEMAKIKATKLKVSLDDHFINYMHKFAHDEIHNIPT